MIRRIDLAKKILEDEEHLLDKVCPHCGHILRVDYEDNDTTKQYLICPNMWCLNTERYEPKGYISPFRS